MHNSAVGKSRKQIVKQVKQEEESVHDYASYVPIGHAVQKLNRWKKQGAKILYLTSRTKTGEMEQVKAVLRKHCFPKGRLLFRRKKEEYRDVAEKIIPTILVEDDCESIGGKGKMTITRVQSTIKKRIKSVIVKEFEGIDHLPNLIIDLMNT
jgi:hypothetical protein